MVGVADGRKYARRKLSGVDQAPKPDVCIEQELHSRSASQASSGSAGSVTMSPTISIVPCIEPSQLVAGCGGGLISATGTPRRVTSTGSRVRRTRSSTERQVALNL